MTTELGLRLPAPEVSEAEILGLCNALHGQHWMTAKELGALYTFTDRELRAIAEASGGRIVSGQRGYALLSECTPEEIDHAAGWLESQARKMLGRAAKIRARWHRYGRICPAQTT